MPTIISMAGIFSAGDDSAESTNPSQGNGKHRRNVHTNGNPTTNGASHGAGKVVVPGKESISDSTSPTSSSGSSNHHTKESRGPATPTTKKPVENVDTPATATSEVSQEEVTAFFLSLKEQTTPTNKTPKNNTSRNNNSSHHRRIMRLERKLEEQLEEQEHEFDNGTLKWDALQLHGRNKEQLQLQECLDRLLGDRQKQLVIIKGEAGTGKSALATHALRKLTRHRHNGLFLVGGFDPYMRQLPYGGFIEICRSMSLEIASLQSEPLPPIEINNSTTNNPRYKRHTHHDRGQVFYEMRERLLKTLGTDLIHDLLEVFPTLESVFFAEPAGVAVQDHDGLDDMSEVSGLTDRSAGRDAHRGGAYPSRGDKTADLDVHLFGYVSSQAKHRFQFAFRTLFRILASYLSPVILLIKNLQWADSASIELLEDLLGDRENKDIMVVCTLRRHSSSNSATECTGHVAASRLKQMSKIKHNITITAADQQPQQDNSCYLYFYSEIEIGNLSVEATHFIVQDLTTPTDATSTIHLAEICHTKTNGNPFYLLRFLAILYDRNLLAFSNYWTWDTKGIMDQTSSIKRRMATSSDGDELTMMEMLSHEILSLPPSHRQALQYAAYLGSLFSERMLKVLWTTLYQDKRLFNSNKKNSLGEILKSCQQHHFLECVGDEKTMLQWRHPLLQEAAMELVSESERLILREEIADTLLETMSDKEVGDAMFVIANLYYGSAFPLEESKKLEWAEVNFQAAKKAATWSAFGIASIFCNRGTQLIPSFPWGEDYQLCRKTCALAAEVEAFLGNIDTMDDCCELVIRNSERPIRDQYRVYNVLMDSLSSRNQSGEAVECCLHVLETYYDCKFPKGPAAITLQKFSHHMRMKNGLRARNAQEVKLLPLMKDRKLIEQMGLFDKLATYCYRSGNELLPLVVFKSLRWTLRHGLCDFSPAAFAMAGMILSGMEGDLASGSVYGNYALLLLSKLKTNEIECRTIFLVHSFALHWTSPIKTMLKPLLLGHEIGLRAGDAEHAMLAIYNYILMAFVSGRTLHSIEKDCRAYTMQMRSLKQKKVYDQCIVTWQLVLNLMGHSKDALVLTGEAMVEAECRKAANTNKELHAILQVHQLLLHSILADYEYCAAQEAAGEVLREKMPGSPLVIQDAFHRGLALLVRSQKTKKKVYAKEGKKLYDKIKHWSDQGNPNVKQYEALLEAELAHSHSRLNVAKRHYETSISVALDGGFIHDAAIANERYGVFLLETVGDKAGATRRLKEACKRFREWGAYAKAEALEAKHTGIFPSQTVAFTT